MFTMATARKRVHLSIDKKVKVIKYAADHPGVGVRAIGELHVAWHVIAVSKWRNFPMSLAS